MVCAIIIVITGLVLIDNNKFGGEVILENLAYDVALTIRETQVYGIAVERFGTSNFDTGYGMHFSLSTPTAYLLFADEDGTGVYDSSASPSEIVEADSLQQGYAITALCVISGTTQGATCNPVNEIDILYVRPEPEAYISASQSGTPPSCVKDQSASCYYEAQVTLTSPKGDTRTVIVDASGQISVQTQ